MPILPVDECLYGLNNKSVQWKCIVDKCFIIIIVRARISNAYRNVLRNNAASLLCYLFPLHIAFSFVPSFVRYYLQQSVNNHVQMSYSLHQRYVRKYVTILIPYAYSAIGQSPFKCRRVTNDKCFSVIRLYGNLVVVSRRVASPILFCIASRNNLAVCF